MNAETRMNHYETELILVTTTYLNLFPYGDLWCMLARKMLPGNAKVRLNLIEDSGRTCLDFDAIPNVTYQPGVRVMFRTSNIFFYCAGNRVRAHSRFYAYNGATWYGGIVYPSGTHYR